MKYRTKLSVAFVATALFCTAAAQIIDTRETKQLLFQEFKSKVLTVAASTAAQINPATLKQIRSRDDEGSAAYLEIQKVLQQSKERNDRQDLNTRYLYTILADPSDPGRIIYGVSGEKIDSSNFSPFGSTFSSKPESDPIFQKIRENYVQQGFERDEFGVFLTATAPIFDDKGNFVGAVGADVRKSDITLELGKITKYGIIAVTIAVFIALFVAYFLSRMVTHSLESICDTVHDIKEGNLETQATDQPEEEFQELSSALNEMIRGLKERKRLQVNFERYVSADVLKKILSSDKPPSLEGEEKKVTLLFSDLRGFTTFAEGRTPKEVVATLNIYLDAMIEIIFKHHGMLDKIMGDGLMVAFGAFQEDEDQEVNAVLCALEMQEKLEELNAKKGYNLLMGIGIHTGNAIVGNIGTSKRMEFTTIGDTVNSAARIEGATKILKIPILISETTVKGVVDHGLQFEAVKKLTDEEREKIREHIKTAALGDLPNIKLRGREKDIKIYSVGKK